MQEFFKDYLVDSQTLKEYEKTYTNTLLNNHKKLNYLNNNLELSNKELLYNTELNTKYNYILKIITLVSVILLICIICIYVVNKSDFSFLVSDKMKDSLQDIKQNMKKTYHNFIDSLKPVKKEN